MKTKIIFFWLGWLTFVNRYEALNADSKIYVDYVENWFIFKIVHYYVKPIPVSSANPVLQEVNVLRNNLDLAVRNFAELITSTAEDVRRTINILNKNVRTDIAETHSSLYKHIKIESTSTDRTLAMLMCLVTSFLDPKDYLSFIRILLTGGGTEDEINDFCQAIALAKEKELLTRVEKRNRIKEAQVAFVDENLVKQMPMEGNPIPGEDFDFEAKIREKFKAMEEVATKTEKVFNDTEPHTNAPKEQKIITNTGGDVPKEVIGKGKEEPTPVPDAVKSNSPLMRKTRKSL